MTARIYNNPVANLLAAVVEEKNYSNLVSCLEIIPENTLQQAFVDKDKQYGENLLFYAMQKDWKDGLNLFISEISKKILKNCLFDVNREGITLLHSLAIYKNDTSLYKKAKKRTHINAKAVTRFFCESPSFLRKCFDLTASYFSCSCPREEKRPHIYIQTGTKGCLIEERLDFKQLIDKHGHLFISIPEHFKLIPQLDQVNCKLVRDENKVAALDEYIKRIVQDKEDKGLALCQIVEDDEGKDLSRQKLGLGVVTRRPYKQGEIVCLYGGELLKKGRKDVSYSILRETVYQAGINQRTGRPETEGFDGKRIRSYGSMVQHSFPNVVFESIYTGFDEFQVLTALVDIPKSSMLAVDYGDAAEKNWIELRPKALKEIKNRTYYTHYVYLRYISNPNNQRGVVAKSR